MGVELPIIEGGIRKYVGAQVADGHWREEWVSAETLGTPRPMRIYRAARRAALVKHNWHGTTATFCPPKWYDLGIGSGACGYGCRYCFLMLTFRAMRDPMSPVVYDNVEDFWRAVRQWLVAEDWKTEARTPLGHKMRRVKRSRHDALGLGIDCSDSLLFEGVTGHARALIPMFANGDLNPRGNKLILLTKSANTHYLEGLPVTDRVAVTFSLNPQAIASLWEGTYGDGVSITPPIEERLLAGLHAQRLGYEVRWRLDPILTPPGWEAQYRDFFRQAASLGLRPRYVTLGSYRQKNAQLDQWRALWGLPAPGWQPDRLENDGTHEHVLRSERQSLYAAVMRMIDEAPWKEGAPRLELCKEPHELRRALRIEGVNCNCLQ